MLTTRALIPSALSCLVGLDAERHLAAGGEQEHVGLASGGVGQDVGALRQAGGGRVLGAVERRQRPAGSARARPGSWCSFMMTFQASTTSLASAGPEHDQAGNRPQGGKLLDRLVGRAVLADADRVVREDIDDRDFHQRREPDRQAGRSR